MRGSRLHRKRGIMYMIAFVTLIVVMMLVGAAFTLMPAQLAIVNKDSDSLLAINAASAGADYVQSRLQNRPTWRGDLDGTGSTAGFTVDTPGLQIYEDKGNVLGLMTQSDGSKQAFRVRFNYQNGSSTSPDDRFSQDPASTHEMKFPLVSCNNLDGWASQNLYEGNSSGSVPNSAVATSTVQRFQSAIFVQGLAGPGMQGATITTLENYASTRGVLRRVAAMRTGFLNQSRIDSAAYAGGGIQTRSLAAPAVLTSAPGAAVANIRALDSMNAVLPTLLQATSSQSRAFYSGSTAPNAGVLITSQNQSKAAQSSRWLKMKWNDVPKAPPTAPTRVKAGTYLWRQNTTTLKPELMYYPEDFSGTGIFTPSTTPTLVSAPADMMTSIGTGVALDMDTMTTTITDTVYIDNNMGATGFSVVIDPAFQAASTIRPGLTLDPDPSKTSIISSTGSFFVQGKIEGVGSITTEGDLKLQGTSLFEADQGDAVVLYSKQDISVESIPPSVASALAPTYTYRPGMGMGRAMGWRRRGTAPADPAVVEDGDVSFAGAVFAMGNFRTNITNGGLYMRGVLSAYGGDPATQDPGSVAGSGIIDISGNRVEFMYDPSYLMTSANLGKPSYLDRISWNLLD